MLASASDNSVTPPSTPNAADGSKPATPAPISFHASLDNFSLPGSGGLGASNSLDGAVTPAAGGGSAGGGVLKIRIPFSKLKSPG
jgi:hypothetical protein